MSRLLKDCPQQHSLPGVLPYDQIESVTLVDAKWTQSVQTRNPVAHTEFPGRIWPLLVVFKAADRGMNQEVMICRVKMFCCWWSFKPTVSPVITMAIHSFVQWTHSLILCSHICENTRTIAGPFQGLNNHIIHVYSYILLTIHLI